MSNRHFKAPSRDAHHRFLASFLFGGTPAPTIRDVVWRAYLDLSRTVHGIVGADSDMSIRHAAHAHVEGMVTDLVVAGPRDQRDFDEWHRSACTGIAAQFTRRGFTAFSVGQSQKWVNMSVKYSLTLAAVGWLGIADSAGLRRVAHAPIDSFFLDGLKRYATPGSMPSLGTPWSRITDYEKYFEFQKRLRKAFSCPPLDVEFHVWQEVSGERRGT